MDSYQYINPLFSVNQHPDWFKTDNTVKGFHFHLLSLSANTQDNGTIPEDDESLRKILNIPIPWAIKKLDVDKQDPVLDFLCKNFDNNHISSVMLDTIQTIFNGNKNDLEGDFSLRISHEEWTNYLWIYVWKPQLLKFWTPVDSKLTRKYSELKGKENKLWNETSYLLSKGFDPSTINNNISVNNSKKPPNRKTKKIELPDIQEVNSILEYSDLGYNGIAWLHSDTTNFRDLSKNLKTWRKPIPLKQTQDMWEVGTKLLCNSPQDVVKARSFLGKLIAQHGDKVVAKAVAELATQSQHKSSFNKQALLIGIIKRETEGTPAEIKARAARSKLAL